MGRPATRPSFPTAGRGEVTVAARGQEGEGSATFLLEVERASGWTGVAVAVAAAAAGVAALGLARRGRAAAVAALLLVGLLLIPVPGRPHASLVRSSPARRAVLLRAPDRVQLWFNERLEPAFSRVDVFDAAGQAVDLGDARVGPDDLARLSVGLRRLAPGTYTVRFRVLSVDGHVVESEFPFTLRGP